MLGGGTAAKKKGIADGEKGAREVVRAPFSRTVEWQKREETL